MWQLEPFVFYFNYMNTYTYDARLWLAFNSKIFKIKTTSLISSMLFFVYSCSLVWMFCKSPELLYRSRKFLYHCRLFDWQLILLCFLLWLVVGTKSLRRNKNASFTKYTPWAIRKHFTALINGVVWFQKKVKRFFLCWLQNISDPICNN